MSSSAKQLRLILGDQLNYQHSWFEEHDKDLVYVFMETRSETDYARHHVQKVVAIFSSMRLFAEHLTNAGHRVHYIKLDDKSNKQSIDKNLEALVGIYNAEVVEYQLPDEYRLDQDLVRFRESSAIKVKAVDTEHFLTQRDELASFFKGKKRYTMEYFYRDMRKRLGVLMDGNEPLGGAWNFDQENRKKLPKNFELPQHKTFNHQLTEIIKLLADEGVETIGEIDPNEWVWPLTPEEAIQTFQSFIEERLQAFGTYQDAMTSRDPFLFHARISYAMNVKLLSPKDVVELTTAYYQEHTDEISINQVEGFIRQVIGWREYMRGIYWAHMPDFAAMNKLEHYGDLPNWYWDGNTKMKCLSHSIGQSLKHAYAHHIQRLMVTGNFALLLGVHPDQVDQWYLGIYIDAFEWVEITNTRGMSQFADGGIVGTKPYMSSANYINKMSDYCKSCSYNNKIRHGENACPFNSLYWAFVERHRERLARNGRIGQMVRLWDRMDADERGATLQQAAYYLENRHSL